MFFRKVLSMHCAMLLELKRKFIIEYHKKGFSPPEIFKLGKKIEINRMLIKRTIDRFEEIFPITDRPRSGRPRSSITTNLIKSVKEKIRRNPRRSMKKNGKGIKNITKNYAQSFVTIILKCHLTAAKETAYFGGHN